MRQEAKVKDMTKSTATSLWKHRILAEAKETFGSQAKAEQWFDAPLATFEDESPAQLVERGRHEAVLGYLQSISSGFIG